MKNRQQLKNSIDKKLSYPVNTEIPAFMGNRQGVVEYDKKNNVYVIDYSGNVLVVANRRGIPKVAKLPVIVGRDAEDPHTLQVLRMRNAYINPPYPNVPEHAEVMHTWTGYDPVYIGHEQIIPGLAFPASDTGMIVSLRGFNYYLNGWHVLDNIDIDFSSEIPASGANWVVAEVDEDGVITLVAGTSGASRENLLPEDIPSPSTDKKQLFAVRCYANQESIVFTKKTKDIFDMRFSGVASGGIATSVEWDDVLNKPLVFPPDTDYTDPLYPRKWYKTVAPTINDDTTEGYAKLDLWLDTVTSDVYICTDDTNGAAVWLFIGTSGSAGGVTSFGVQGRLAVVDNCAIPILITTDTTIEEWRMYLEDLGTSGSTILDVDLIRVGEATQSIFVTKPEIAFDDADNLIVATPTITTFLAGDVLICNIDQVAPGASSFVLGAVAVSSGGGGGGGSTPFYDSVTLASDQAVSTLADLTDLTLTETLEDGVVYRWKFEYTGTKTTTSTLNLYITDESNNQKQFAYVSLDSGYGYHSNLEYVEIGTGVSVTRKVRASCDAGSFNFDVGTNQITRFSIEKIGGTGGAAGNLSVTDGTTPVNNVLEIEVSGMAVEDLGNNAVKISRDYILLHRDATNGTHGGDSVANAWTKLVISTEILDAGNHCSLSSGVITLGAGTYNIRAESVFYNVSNVSLRFRNTSDSITNVLGNSVAVPPSSVGTASLFGRFTISSPKDFELQYIAYQAQATNGLGVSAESNMSNYDEKELYTIIELEKVA